MNDNPKSGANGDAAAWYARLQADDATLQDRRAFAQWHDADPEHQRAWAAVRHADTNIGHVAHDPAIQAMLSDALAIPSRRGSLWKGLAAAAAMVATVGGASILLWQRLDVPPSPQMASIREFRTETGGRSTVRLPDGSVVTLDTESVVRVPDWGAERRVTLVGGRAFFKVAKDAAHPFVVTAGGNSVTALGTAFDVRVEPGRFGVALVEGRVRVETPAAKRTTILDPGGTLIAEGRAIRLAQGEADQATGWLAHRLTFDEAPLDHVVAEMNRYSERKLILNDTALRSRKISGVFHTGEPTTLAAALERSRIARIVQDDDQRIVLTRY
ncbi:iron dicitrate transport regulator FecR [Sphingomonas oleivorans]|uniref:Iron dicitrate transport regulator FecR n=1 Tax=Sphingomonas oleivorans TaxID=1735121 RepID=A0A2T5FUN5_9SPHN|nr:FecR domain-containing protein [Sphingomonas oleivorans]PTQ08238.1 iron dicitrate transport regulator FecR [Sphingomonas oleivorans]